MVPPRPSPPTPLTARRYERGRYQVLELSGEGDLATGETLRTEIDQALSQRPPALIVDLTRVSFCDGHCARLILRAARHSPVVTVGLAGAAALVFELLDPAGRLPRHPCVDDAVSALSELPSRQLS
ncbi:MAG TPA: STAS domain-containing protein [Intrasporangium sp.]|nr:STAS domain-containing protein [Intrasporangium sp.]